MNPFNWNNGLHTLELQGHQEAKDGDTNNSMVSALKAQNGGDTYCEYSRYQVDLPHCSTELKASWKGTSPPIQDLRVEDPDGEPLGQEELINIELERKLRELKEIQQKILFKKAALALRHVGLSHSSTAPPSGEGETLQERVNCILHQRSLRGLMPKRWSPEKRNKSFQQQDHPLKLRVKALMEQRSRALNHLPANTKVSNMSRNELPSDTIGNVTPSAENEDTNNIGFQRFVNILNKGVDIDLLSRIVNDDCEDLPVGKDLTIHSPSVEEGNLTPRQIYSEDCVSGCTQRISEQENSDTNKRPPVPGGKEEKERKDRGCSSFGSRSQSNSPSVSKKKKTEDDKHDQLQSILKTLGLNLEGAELIKVDGRIQERLYGRKCDDGEVDMRQEKTHLQRGFRRGYKSSSSSSSSSSRSSPSLSPSNSVSLSPSPSHSRDSKNAEHSSSQEANQKTEDLWESEDKNNHYNQYPQSVTNLHLPFHLSPHTFPLSPVLPSLSTPSYPAYSNYSWPSYSENTSNPNVTPSSHTIFPQTISPFLSRNSYPYPTGEENLFPRPAPTPTDIQVLWNPDLSTSEGQGGSSSQCWLQEITTKRPTDNQTGLKLLSSGKNKRSDIEGNLECREQLRQKWKEKKMNKKTYCCEQLPQDVSKSASQDVKYDEEEVQQAQEGKRLVTEEEIEMNLRKKLETFNRKAKQQLLQPTWPLTTNTQNNSEHGRKHRTRKNQGCQGGPVNKRPRSQNRRNRRNFDVTKEDNGNLSIESPIETSELGGSGLMAERTHCHDDRPKLSVVYNCRKNKDKRYRNNNNRYQQRKQLESQVHQRDEENRCRGGSSRGRGDGRHKHVKLVKGPKPMSEEFKEQNALMVDGQLVCRHFLYGRCIKGDECQLKHIQGYNDCIKKVCKFYVQGFCTKGAGCPYMHKSFPCKFFHRKGTCLNGELCMFSHEPLNETTAMLLEEALKRDNDLYELATKAEQKSPMQQASTDDPGSTDTMETADVDLATLRLQFYHSRETNPEQEAVCSETEIEEVSDSTLPTEGFELYNPPSVTSSYLQSEEPVCYSVEAVLGPRLYRPFPRFSPTPVSQDLSSQSSSQKPSDLGCQSQAPCSVDTILSCKSGRKVLRRTSSPTTAQSLSLFGDCKKLTELLPGSETKSSMSGKKDMTEPQEEMSDISTMPPEDTQTCKEEVGAGPGHFLLSAPAPESESFRREVNLQDSGHPGHVLPSVSCGSAGAVAFSPMDCKRQTSAHSSRSRLHSPGLVLDSEGSGLSKITCRPAQPVEESSRAQRLSEKPQSDLKPGKQLHESTLAPSESNSETVNSGAGTREKQFSSLFSNPITGDHRSDTDVSQAHSPASHCRSKGTASDGTSTRPFLCLFTSLKDTSETPIQTEQSSTAFKLFDTSTSSSPCGGADHSRTHTRISPTVSSPKGATTAAVTTSPDLKTLFLSLSPYKADEEWKDGVSADTIEVRGSFQRLFTQHQTKKKKRKKKRPRTKCDQRKRTSSHLDHGASRHISPHVTEETTLSSLEPTRPQETKA